MADGPGSKDNWGRWGEDDERGALNLLTPERVLAALGAATSGRVFPLGVPIQRSGVPNVEYRGIPQRLTMVNHSDEAMFEPFGGSPGTGCNEDVLVMASHTTTHMDALCHVYHEGAVYNGFKADDFPPYLGAPRCGIEKSGGVVARGVLIDVAAHKGVEWLDPGYVVTLEDVEGALAAQGTELRAGDAMIVRTGWLSGSSPPKRCRWCSRGSASTSPATSPPTTRSSSAPTTPPSRPSPSTARSSSAATSSCCATAASTWSST